MNAFVALSELVPKPGETADWKAFVEIIPSLSTLDQTPQDARWHAEGDVGTHTRRVCAEVARLDDYGRADEDTRFVLFYAALLHDIAKPSCTRHEPDGSITSAGHSRRGSIDSRILLWRLAIPFTLRERICRIIAAHQKPFFTIQGDYSGRSPEYLIRKLSYEANLRELICVAEADGRGRICDNWQETLDNVALFRELAIEEGCLDSPRAFADDHTRISYFRSNGAISPDYPFFQEKGSSVIMMAGTPASGKDTWIAANAQGLPVVSFDDMREELGLSYGDNAGTVTQKTLDKARELLRRQTPFVWNATHLSAQMRKKTLDLLYAYHADVTIVYLESPENVIKTRNAKRDTTLTNARIDTMLQRWEVPLPTEAHRVDYLVAS